MWWLTKVFEHFEKFYIYIVYVIKTFYNFNNIVIEHDNGIRCGISVTRYLLQTYIYIFNTILVYIMMDYLNTL